jgi:hypothetical protein
VAKPVTFAVVPSLRNKVLFRHFRFANLDARVVSLFPFYLDGVFDSNGARVSFYNSHRGVAPSSRYKFRRRTFPMIWRPPLAFHVHQRISSPPRASPWSYESTGVFGGDVRSNCGPIVGTMVAMISTPVSPGQPRVAAMSEGASKR